MSLSEKRKYRSDKFCVRRYGLYFPDTNTNAVMYTDSTGAATVRIAMPAHMQSSLIFHYNLKFYDNDGDGYDGVSLKRFVMQVN